MEGGGGGANLSAPPAWASSATWLNGALSLDLPNVKRAMEVEAILVEDKEVEVTIANEQWSFPLPCEVGGGDMQCEFNTDTQRLTLKLPTAEVSVVSEMEQLRLKAQEEARLYATWRDDRAMFGEGYEFVPLRLTPEERATLHVLEGTLDVSEYTDEVDVYHGMSLSMTGYRGFGYYGGGMGYGSRGAGGKASKIAEQIEDALSTASGLELASNYKKGKALVKEKSFGDNAEYFQRAFEVVRRHKIMNPGKMRSIYGKMMFMLQDAADRSNRGAINFDPILPLVTVRQFLESRGGDALLRDPQLDEATQFITTEGAALVAEASARKKAAVEELCSAHASASLSSDDIHRALNSIGDANAYAASNARPVARMIMLLKTFFDPAVAGDYSLEIRARRGGSCLSHSHATQYVFVMQSLVLWREITASMYRCWYAADQDLLSERNPYRLTNTGQGLNRVQSAPMVSRLMSNILSKVKSEVSGWVGLSVVHLGDRDVPNALVFIDKYTQVPRILAPIVTTIEKISEIYDSDPKLARYIDNTFGGVRECQAEILQDFFKHGFDGSGDDGGSCIDGRLTSAWNWCSQLSKKRYYHIFLLTGFKSFDGDWSTQS